MNTLVTLVSLVIALSIMVLVHELGHLLAAKGARVVVEEFGVGYPPRLLALWRSRGKMMVDGKQLVIPRRFALPDGLRTGSYVTYRADAGPKGLPVLAQIREVAPDDPAIGEASQIELLDRGTLYSVNAIPFGGFTKMLGEEDPTFPGSLASKRKTIRIVVLAAGAAMNLLAAVFFFALALGLGAPVAADPENAVVSDVSPGSPAELSGLQPGDIIVQADDTPVLAVADLQAYTQSNLGSSITLTVQRGDETLEIDVVPRVNPPAQEGPMGVSLRSRTVVKAYPLHEAAWMGLKETVSLTGFILTVPVQVIRGLIPVGMARPVGPVGVGQLVGDAVQYSLNTGWWFPVMQMMGTLSVALAVTNLLPLPALDGGRILFVVVEAVRGRRVDPAREGLVHLIGMLLLVALMLFITWQDVVNPAPTLDWSRFF